MAEPTIGTGAFVATGVIAAALGPVLGPAALICFGAVAGSLLAMSKANTPTFWHALWFVMVGVLIAIAIAGGAAWALDRYLGVPQHITLMPVAAVIGAVRNSILALMDAVVATIGEWLSRIQGKP